MDVFSFFRRLVVPARNRYGGFKPAPMKPKFKMASAQVRGNK
jgi:hypothetical protein